MDNPESSVPTNRRDNHRQPNDGNLQRSVGMQYKFTLEEKRTLRDCNRESFYFRCVPFAICGMVGVRYAIHRGFLRPNAKWGSTPKVGVAAFVGWILGKFSYRSTCEKKLMQLPNSQLGELLRQKHGITQERFPTEGLSEEFSDSSWEGSRLRADFSSSGSLNLDVDKNKASQGLDDASRPSLDRSAESTEEAEVPKKTFTSYDELRKRNRDEYSGIARPFSSPSPFSKSHPPRENKDADTDSGGTASGLKHKNQYGDSWDD